MLIPPPSMTSTHANTVSLTNNSSSFVTLDTTLLLLFTYCRKCFSDFHSNHVWKCFPCKNHRWLTGAVGLCSWPGPIGLTLSGGGAGEQVAVHAGVNDRVGERGPVQAKHSAVTGSAGVATLHGWGVGRRSRQWETNPVFRKPAWEHVVYLGHCHILITVSL